MGEIASGCSCELFSSNVSSKARNKYTTTDTESDSDDGNASNDDSDGTQQTEDNPQTTEQYVIRIQTQQTKQEIVQKSKPKKYKKSKKRDNKKKKRKKDNKKKKHKKHKKDKIKSPKTPIKMINKGSNSSEINDLIFLPEYFEQNGVLIPKTETFNYIGSKQMPPNQNKLIFSNEETSPYGKLNLIDESSDLMEKQTIIYHSNDNGSVNSFQFDNLSLKSSHTLPTNNYMHQSMPMTKLACIRSKSVGPEPQSPLDLPPFIERRYSSSPTNYKTLTPIITPSSDSLPSLIPPFPSFSKSYTANSMATNTNISSTTPPYVRSNTTHNSGYSGDTLFLHNINAKSNKSRKSKANQVLTTENCNDWSVVRMVSEKDAMKRQLLFLKQFERSRKPNNYWIEQNDDSA